MAEQTQNPDASRADNIAPDFERKQNQRLMIASSISVAVNLMFLIGAARGMEERSVPEKPDRPMAGVIRLEPAATPTPAIVTKPTPTPIAHVEPKPEPRETPPPVRPREHVRVRYDEPTPRVTVQLTPPPPPDVPEIPEVQPEPPPIQPVEEPAATTPVAEPETTQARVARMRESTASNRMTDASLATNAASVAPSLRRGMSSPESGDPGVAAPSLAGGPSTLSIGIRTPRTSVVEAVADGTTTNTNGEPIVSGVTGRQWSASPKQRIGNPDGNVGPTVGRDVVVDVRGWAQPFSGSESVRGAVGAPVGADTSRSNGRDSGIRAGSGANTSRDFGIKGGTGKTADWDGKGTGSAEGAGRAAIAVVAGGGGGRDIVSTTPRFRDNNGETIQVTPGKDPRTARPASTPKTEGLSPKIEILSIEAVVEARILTRKQPEITEAMRETHPGRVTVEFFVATDGSATYKIVRSSGNADVDAAVSKACAGYRWQAGSKGGKPVSSRQRVTFDPNE